MRRGRRCSGASVHLGDVDGVEDDAGESLQVETCTLLAVVGKLFLQLLQQLYDHVLAVAAGLVERVVGEEVGWRSTLRELEEEGGARLDDVASALPLIPRAASSSAPPCAALDQSTRRIQLTRRPRHRAASSHRLHSSVGKCNKAQAHTSEMRCEFGKCPNSQQQQQQRPLRVRS